MLICTRYFIAAALIASLYRAGSVFAEDGVPLSWTAKTPPAASLAATQAEQGASKGAAKGEQSQPKIEEIRPSVYYLPDKQGNLQAVLDFNYEDFIDLYKLKQRIEQRDERPRYSIQRMEIVGAAGAENAELTVQLQIVVGERDWVRIPLGFDQGLLRAAVQYRGTGEQFVHYESEGDGYVCWIRGKKDDPHQLTLKLLVPLSIARDETRLKLNVPRATGSELKLKTSQTNAEGAVLEGATLLPPVAEKDGGTQFTAMGLGGEFQLAWHKPGLRAAETPAVIEASATILARFDNQGVASEATLSIHGYGAAIDRFVVRLPRDASLAPTNPTSYSLLPLERKNDADGRRKLVEVRLQKKTKGPVEVRLSTRRDFNQEADRDGFDLSGFEVVGAVRQWGVIAVATGNDRQVVWGDLQCVRQVDSLPESLRSAEVVAGFEYSAFPYTLKAAISPRTTRINVDPEYVIYVEKDRLRLEAKLSCFIRGAKVNVLRLSMPDWEIDEAGPENIVAQESVDLDDNGLLSIPLQQPASGKLELRFIAHKLLDKSANAFSAALPVPEVFLPSSAIVAIVPADNVEVTPEAKSIEGLIRQQTAVPMKLSKRQQDPIFYRSEGKNSIFAAKMLVHSRTMSMDAANYVNLDNGLARVEQRFKYFIAHEAADNLLLEVPEIVSGSSSLEVQHDDKPLTAKVLAKNNDSRVAPGMVRMKVNLPEPVIGKYELSVQYSLKLMSLGATATTNWNIPLVMPTDAESSNNKLYLTAEPGIKIAGYGRIWKPADKMPVRTGRQTRMELQSNRSQKNIRLVVQKTDAGEADSTIVERAWIQTLFTSSVRQDRAVFQFTTNRKEIVIRLPKGVASEQMLVLLDGKRMESRLLSDNRISLTLADDTKIHAYQIELRYHFSEPRQAQGFASIEFPRLNPNVWTRRMYWQLVLPQNEHVLSNPPGFVGEYNWKWCGYFWGREPILNQAQLESWIGTPLHAVLPEGASVYLYGTLGNADRAEISTISRTLIVSIASGGALILGLLLIYVPLMRHPFSLLVLSLGVLSLAMIYPEPAIMIAQASGLGLALTILAGMLERSMARRRKMIIPKEPSIIIRDLASSRMKSPSLPAVPPSSTMSLPAVSQTPPEEQSQ